VKAIRQLNISAAVIDQRKYFIFSSLAIGINNVASNGNGNGIGSQPGWRISKWRLASA